MSDDWDYACHQCGQVRCGCANATYRRVPKPDVSDDIRNSLIANERDPLDVAKGALDQYDDPEADKRISSRILARAVIAQADEIAKLKAALGEAIEQAESQPQINDWGPDPDVMERLRRLL